MARILTADAANQVKYFYKTGVPFSWWTIAVVCPGASLVALLVPALLGKFTALTFLVPVILFATAGFGIDQYFRNRKITRAKEVYQYGDEVTIYFESGTVNWGSKVNGAPQKLIYIRKGGETITIKTFEQKVKLAFEVPVQKAYYLTKYPDILLPQSIFSPGFYNLVNHQTNTTSRSINM